MKHEPLSSIIQGGGKRRIGIGYAGSEQIMNVVYNEFPKWLTRGLRNQRLPGRVLTA